MFPFWGFLFLPSDPPLLKVLLENTLSCSQVRDKRDSERTFSYCGCEVKAIVYKYYFIANNLLLFYYCANILNASLGITMRINGIYKTLAITRNMWDNVSVVKTCLLFIFILMRSRMFHFMMSLALAIMLTTAYIEVSALSPDYQIRLCEKNFIGANYKPHLEKTCWLLWSKWTFDILNTYE